MPVDLMSHQKEAADNLSNGKVLWGGVGTGKTRTAMAYYARAEAPKNIYVITTAKKRDDLDWESEAQLWGIGINESITGFGTIKVDSWNAIPKYKNVEDAFFIFDEQRLVGNGVWVKSFLTIAGKNNWILLSATPGDTWSDYAPVFIANGYFKNVTQFRREHVVYRPYVKFPQISHYVGVQTLEKYKNLTLVEMPYMRTTERFLEDYPCEYDLEAMRRVAVDRWNIFEDEPIKDVAELYRCMRRVCYEDPSRLDGIVKLLQDHPKLIIFYNFNYELDILRGLSDRVTVAEWNGHRKQPIPTTESWVYLVQYTAGAEGWNCIETNAMVFYSMTYSYKIFEQAQGRIDRLDAPVKELYYFVLQSEAQVEKKIRSVVDQKQIFNERDDAKNYGF
jgi:hypothetical protein